MSLNNLVVRQKGARGIPPRSTLCDISSGDFRHVEGSAQGPKGFASGSTLTQFDDLGNCQFGSPVLLPRSDFAQNIDGMSDIFFHGDDFQIAESVISLDPIHMVDLESIWDLPIECFPNSTVNHKSSSIRMVTSGAETNLQIPIPLKRWIQVITFSEDRPFPGYFDPDIPEIGNRVDPNISDRGTPTLNCFFHNLKHGSDKARVQTVS